MTDDAEIRRISRHLLLSSPPGQFDLILSDLKSILGPSTILTEEWIQDVQRDFGSENNASSDHVEHGGGETSELATTVRDKMTCNVLPRNGVDSKCMVTQVEQAGSRILQIIVRRENVSNLNKYYSGSWTSSFTASVSSDGNCDLRGVARVHAHSFEDCNVQLRCKREFGPQQLSGSSSDDKDIAEAIAKQISCWESDLLDALGNMYSTMGDRMLKSMRRVMPISRTRMDWNVHPHRMVKNLSSGVSNGANDRV